MNEAPKDGVGACVIDSHDRQENFGRACRTTLEEACSAVRLSAAANK